MCAIIVFLTIGLYNMFKNPQKSINTKNTIIFSDFLSEVENGTVVKVEIKGKNIIQSGGKVSVSWLREFILNHFQKLL